MDQFPFGGRYLCGRSIPSAKSDNRASFLVTGTTAGIAFDLESGSIASITDRSDTSGDSQHYICLSLYLKDDDTDAANIYDNHYLLQYYYDAHAICLNTTRENAALYGNRNWQIEDPRLIAFFSELFP